VSISLSYDQLYYGAWYLIRRVGGVATEIGSAPPSGNNQPYGFAAPMWQNDGEGIISKKACRSFLDTPNTTLPVTYELWVYSTETTHNFFILNGTYNNSDNSINGRGTSQMTLQEFFK
jgi:hypothetical protein